MVSAALRPACGCISSAGCNSRMLLNSELLAIDATVDTHIVVCIFMVVTIIASCTNFGLSGSTSCQGSAALVGDTLPLRSRERTVNDFNLLVVWQTVVRGAVVVGSIIVGSSGRAVGDAKNCAGRW